jgi:flagellar hook-associated protein 1 FlgK
MSLFNLGITGLNAAQSGLTVTGNNIDNSGTDGYNRERVITSTAGETPTGQGYYGRGVQVDTVQRQYDSFLYKQLVGAQGDGAATSTFSDQISQIDNMLGDDTTGVSPALQDFFTSINAVASSPADASSRQDMIGKAQALVSQLNGAYQDLQTQRDGLNQQITSAVGEVNQYLNQISSLNQQIVVARAQANGADPNSLLDQRDQILSQLSQVVGINYTQQGDMVNVSLTNGQTLVAGNTVYPLQAVASSSDPSRTVVAYSLPAPGGGSTTVQLSDSSVSGGTLGGLLQFRTQSLDQLQNRLGQMAVGLAMEMNAQQAQGVDTSGNPGAPIFSLSSVGTLQNTVGALPNAKNTDSANISATYTDASQITASDYSIKYSGGTYTVTRLSDNTQVYSGDGTGTVSFDGLTLNMPTTAPADGDTWTLEPTRNAARDIAEVLGDPGGIAASSTTNPGSANGDNALAMAQLQTSKNLAGNTLSVTDLYAQLVDTVGEQASAAQSNDKAQQAATQQALASQQSVSGVNLNEEYVNLSQYQEQYQAAAKIISTAGTIFDAILGMDS